MLLKEVLVTLQIFWEKILKMMMIKLKIKTDLSCYILVPFFYFRGSCAGTHSSVAIRLYFNRMWQLKLTYSCSLPSPILLL